MAIVKKSKNNKCWWECGEKRTLYTVGGNVNWCSRQRKQYAGSSKTLKTELPAVPHLSVNPEESESTNFKRYMRPNVHSSTI